MRTVGMMALLQTLVHRHSALGRPILRPCENSTLIGLYSCVRANAAAAGR
jgi:hypothetical protein